MRFSLDRESLLRPLQAIQGALEKRSTRPILSNILVACTDDRLSVSATDLEVELVAHVAIETAESGETTIPGRKFIDICRALPDGAQMDFKLENNRVLLRSGRSRFTLNTLPASDYPISDVATDVTKLSAKQADLKRLLELTQFAMAHQDVRYYLNGLMLETGQHCLRAVATDGHRLAMAEVAAEVATDGNPLQIIIPRKGILELSRLLSSSEDMVELAISPNSLQVTLPEIRFTSKLIDGRFPDYTRVLPEEGRCDKEVVAERDAVRQSLLRASILSNEKYRAVRMTLEPGNMRVLAHNPEQEEAEDLVEVTYTGESLEIGFNVSYLLDACGAVPTPMVRMYLTDSSSSCLIKPDGVDDCRYVVMPMKL